jgi:hypothetical protein
VLNAQIGQIDLLGACFYFNIMAAGNAGDLPGNGAHLGFVGWPNGKVWAFPLQVAVHIQETDGAFFGIPGKSSGHIPEMINKIGGADSFREQNRVIPPDNSFSSNFVGKPQKRIDNFRLWRQIRFDIVIVGRQSELKIAGIILQELKPVQHMPGVFCPEDNAVNVRWRKRNPANLMGIQRIAHQNKSFANTVFKPVAVKSGDIRPAAATDDHNYPGLELF